MEWPNVSVIFFAVLALFNVSLRGIIATRYFCVGVWGSLFGNLHHVEVHQSGVLVLVLQHGGFMIGLAHDKYVFM